MGRGTCCYNPCSEAPVVRIGLLEYCAEHALVVAENRRKTLAGED